MFNKETSKEVKTFGKETQGKRDFSQLKDKSSGSNISEELFKEDSKSLGNKTSKKKTKILGKETFQESNLLAKRIPKKKAKTLDRKEFLSIRFQRFRLQTIKDRLNEIRTAISLAKPNMSDMPGVP